VANLRPVGFARPPAGRSGPLRQSVAAGLLLVLFALLASVTGSTRLERADFVLNNGTEITTLDPATVTGVPEGRVMRALYEGLVTKDPRTLEPLPGSAESWEVSPDRRTYTFHLREDARWSNGDRLDAGDFLWSWERLLHPETAAEYAYQLWYVKGARAWSLAPTDLWYGEGGAWIEELGGGRARVGLHGFALVGLSEELQLRATAAAGEALDGGRPFVELGPEGAPELRYCYHEVIEEAHHSLFFNEFVQRVRRVGLDVRPPAIVGAAERQVIRFGRRFPELFFFFVLSGEDPIDWVQRRALAGEAELHPLIERISRIHVTEEARHMAFARHYLRRHVPELRGPRLFVLRVRTAIVMKVAAQLMMRPSRHVVRRYGIPRSTLQEAYGRRSVGAQQAREALAKSRELCWELGVLNERWAPLWKLLGIYAPRAPGDRDRG